MAAWAIVAVAAEINGIANPTINAVDTIFVHSLIKISR